MSQVLALPLAHWCSAAWPESALGVPLPQALRVSCPFPGLGPCRSPVHFPTSGPACLLSMSPTLGPVGLLSMSPPRALRVSCPFPCCCMWLGLSASVFGLAALPSPSRPGHSTVPAAGGGPASAGLASPPAGGLLWPQRSLYVGAFMPPPHQALPLVASLHLTACCGVLKSPSSELQAISFSPPELLCIPKHSRASLCFSDSGCKPTGNVPDVFGDFFPVYSLWSFWSLFMCSHYLL